jgi:DNA replication protein DnaC
MAAAAEKWGKDCMANSRGAPRLLVLCGETGVGKTMCLRGLSDYFTATRIRVWELTFWPKGPPEISFTLWSRWANLDPAKGEDADLFRELTRPDVLLLDDVGAEADRFKSGAAIANLTELLSRRAEKWTAISMNYLPETWVGTEAVPGRFGKRVGDRLLRNSTVIAIRNTPSWALTHRAP